MADFSPNTRSARVDMTPMVDLGFLLITFFMFTATFNQPFVKSLILPKRDSKSNANIRESNTLTLILGNDNKIFWHQKNMDAIQISNFDSVSYGKELRQLVVAKRKSALNPEFFTVIIHPTDEANYKNVVDVLDEMTIANQDLYALADIFPKEKELFAKLK